ncbi:MAG TPA: SCO1664 family protein [Anaerolineales bacterium]|nr:SCO1664 family protein [Anaerolineales bacterium]
MAILEDQATILAHLSQGEIEVSGQFMWGSNYTFLCSISYQDETIQAVYKPTRGERPLWDFPNETLAGREVAAYLISQAGGWEMVPPTVYREDAPAGPGSLQLFIEHDPDYHFLNFSADDKARTRAVALFDAVANNTDRKAGHVLVGEDHHLWLIDHGVCFHTHPKLRTVIWDFAGQPLTEAEQTQLSELRTALASNSKLLEDLNEYLSHREILAVIRRIDQLLESGCFPYPDENRPHMPWPPV